MRATDFSRNTELITRYHSGDESAISEILELNQGLINSIAIRFRDRAAESHGMELDDLTQIGAIGLIKAVRSFDMSFGTAFSTYAVPLIIGEIKRFLRDDGPIKVSRTTKRLGAEIMREREAYIKREGREPTVDELSELLHISREELVSAVASGRPLHSFSDTLGDGDVKLEEMLASDSDELEALCDRLALRQAISSLPPLWREIVVLRYFRDMSQQQTAEMLGLTQVKVSREEKKIITALREKFL